MPEAVAAPFEDERGEAADVFGAPEETEPFDVTDDEVDEAQDLLDAAPCIAVAPRAPTRPRYKTGTRQEAAPREVASGEGSWWTRPDADFGREAQRMRAQPTKLKIPGELHILGMSGVF